MPIMKRTAPWKSRRILRSFSRVGCLVFLGVVACSDAKPPKTGDLTAQRETMVETQIAARGINDPATLEAMRTVPRHEFLPMRLREEAYMDYPLPIGHGQTISQPFIVAFMTEAIRPQPGEKILEIGAGSGYQAAILAQMGAEVYTIEIVEPLAEMAWQSDLTPDLLGLLAVVPERMSAVALFQYVRHLRDNQQRSDRYEIAFWKKFVYPLAVVVMIPAKTFRPMPPARA